MSDTVNIGEFDCVITFLTPLTTKTSAGAISTEWKDGKKVYASVEEGAINEDVNDNLNMIGDITIEITMYRLANISTQWRLRYLDNVYDITSIQNKRYTPFAIVSATRIVE